MSISNLLLTLALTFSVVAVALAADLDTKTGTQWSPYLEWKIENLTWPADPFDVVVTVTFTHKESGKVHATEMFYDGEQTWKFRFTGTRTGEWTFVTSSEDTDLSGHTGSVRIIPNPNTNAHGFLKKFNDKWGWQGTEQAFVPQLVMWEYIAGGSEPRSFHDNSKLIDKMIAEFIAGHGFTGFHMPMIAGHWFDFDAKGRRVAPSMSDPDPRTFEALELLITKTHAAGGVVHIWAWGDHQRSLTPRSLKDGMNGKVDKRLQRYIAARLGPIPGWSMGYGFDLDEWVKSDQLAQWCKYMHQHLGWHHFLGGRPVGPNRGTKHSMYVSWNQAPDYSSYEHHRPDYDVYVAALENVPGKPAMSEDRFRIRKSPYPEKDYSEELTRTGLYLSTMAGGVANIWGNALTEGGIYLNKDQLKTYSVFFFEKNRFLPDMGRVNELATGDDVWVLFSPSTKSYILYAENTGAIKIDLSAMPHPARAVAVDATKSYEEIDLGTLKPADQTINLPSASDWVVAIGSFGSDALIQPQFSFTNIWSGPKLKGGHGAMWADVDDNGLPDLYLPLLEAGDMPDLFMYNESGKFFEQGRMRGIADLDGGTHGAVWCDLDNDGDYDLVNGTTADTNNNRQNNVFRNDGTGNFTEVKPAAIEERKEKTRAVISFDMEGDGDLDIFAVTNYRGSADSPEERNEVYRNDGNFNFTSITSGALYTCPAAQGAADTDYDGDGDVDVFVANRTGLVNILQNDGKGEFILIAPSKIGISHRAEDGITTADIDNDGDLDLLLAGDGGSTGHLYLNDGAGSFAFKRSFSDIDGYMGGFADLDNDGDLDLYFAGDTKVYLNDGTGSFEKGPPVPVEGKNDPRGVSFADIDNDGDMDFAFGCKRADRNFIIRNDLQNGGNYLKVKLISPNGQAGAFGAKTYVYTSASADKRLVGMRESKSNYGYLAQDDPVLHFGLGVHTKVDVVVRFLDGTAIVRKNLPSNQTIIIDASNES